MLIAAFGVFYFEQPVQPRIFTNLFDSIWLALCTLTTVGYGIFSQLRQGGKIIAGSLSVIGIGIIALPTGILASGIMEKIGRNPQTCHHCGKELN